MVTIDSKVGNIAIRKMTGASHAVSVNEGNGSIGKPEVADGYLSFVALHQIIGQRDSKGRVASRFDDGKAGANHPECPDYAIPEPQKGSGDQEFGNPVHNDNGKDKDHDGPVAYGIEPPSGRDD